jgi:hypothetical protein
MRVFTLVFILLFYFPPFVSEAQKLKPVRLEVPGNLKAETYKVVPLESKKTIVFYESSATEEDKRVWYFALLDSKLKQRWLKKVPITDAMVFVKSAKTRKKVYFLFKNFGKTGQDYDVYEIVIYDRIDDHFMSLAGSLPRDVEIKDFQVIKDRGCLALNKKGFEADLAFINLSTGEIEPVHLDEESGAMIETLYADKAGSRFFVVVKYYNKITFFHDEIVAFDLYGNKKFSLKSDYPNNLRLPRNHQFVKVTRNEVQLAGTYDLITGRKPDWKDVFRDDNHNAMTAGFFYLKFKDGKQDTLRFYDFMKFGNIHYAKKGTQVAMTKKNTKSKNEQSSKKVNVYFFVNNPEVTKLGKQNVFSVELYKPYYVMETRMDYDFYGRMYPYTYEVFAGYEFYDVVFAGFDDNGKMLWNNDFPISDLLTYSLDDHIIIVPDDPLLTLAYVTKGELVSQTFEKSKDISEREKIKIETAFKKDRVMEDENNKIVHWYDEFYLIYGYQKIRNRALQDKSNRTVFFINKVAFK